MSQGLDLTGRLRAWSYHRQLLSQAASSPLEALRAVVAVYSSHPTAPLALLARVRSLEAVGFTELESLREAVRMPGMRGSIFLMPAETAPRILAATRQPLEKHAGRLRYAGLDRDGYERLKERVLEHAQEPISARGLQEALETHSGSTAEVRVMAGVRVMAYEGVVFRLGTSLRTDNLRYVAAEAWLGHPREARDPVESLGWLAREYLRGYGPARVEDFAWWAGVPKGKARAALATVDAVDIGGGLLLPAEERDDFERVEPVDPKAIDILPKWDAYTMGHGPDGRRRFVDDAHLRSAYSTGGGGTLPGDGLPLVLRGGRVVARWSHRFEGGRLRISVTPFEPDAVPPGRLARAFDGVGQLLGATGIEIVAAASASDR